MAGQCAGLVDKIKPAGEVVRDLVEGAEKLIAGRLHSIVKE